MEADIQRRLQALTSLGWTHAILWVFSPQTRLLSWGDGAYNGSLASSEAKFGTDEKRIQREIILQDSQFSSFLNPNTLRSQLLCTASLDLSDSEWFYIISTSFSFPLGVGLIGNAMSTGRWGWVCGTAKDATCSRTKLSKAGGIKTLVAIPLQGGVIELASDQEIHENSSMVQYVEAVFHDQPALFRIGPNSPLGADRVDCSQGSLDTSGFLESFTSSSLTNPHSGACGRVDKNEAPVMPSESVSTNMHQAVQEMMPEYQQADYHNLGRDFESQLQQHALLVKLIAEQEEHAASKASIDSNLQNMVSHLDNPASASKKDLVSKAAQGAEDVHRNSSFRAPQDFDPSGAKRVKRGPSHLAQDSNSNPSGMDRVPRITRRGSGEEFQSGTPKHVLPLHSHHADFDADLSNAEAEKMCGEGEINNWCIGNGGADLQKARGSPLVQRHGALNGFKSSPISRTSYDPSCHILTERRRREKLNSQFLALRAVVPKVTKMDKASVLSDAVSYIEDLKRRICELESQVERDRRSSCSKSSRSPPASQEDNFNDTNEPNNSNKNGGEAVVEVQMIDNTAVITVSCLKRSGLQSDIFHALSDLNLDLLHANVSTFGTSSVCVLNAKHLNPDSQLTAQEIMKRLRRAINMNGGSELPTNSPSSSV